MTQIRIGSDQWAFIVDALADDRGRERMAFLLCGRNRHSAEERLLCHEVIPVDEAAYQISRATMLAVDPIYVNSVLNSAERGGWSVVMVHNHPGATRAAFSAADDHGEERLFPLLTGRMSDRIHGAMVIAGEHAAFRTWRAGARNPEPGTVVVLGRADESQTTGPTDDESYLSREVLFLGSSVRQALSGLRVGIIGVGGTGSLVAQMLAHLHVGEIVLVDHDSLETSNLSRVVGSHTKDVGRPKVEIAARAIHQTSPLTRVNPIAKTVLSPEAIDSLLDVDFMFGCTDTHSSRLLLNQVAWQYLIPLLDLGALIRIENHAPTFIGGAVRVVMPGHLCLICDQQIDSARITWELKADEQQRLDRQFGYVPGFDAPEPAVITINSIVAGLASTVFLNLIGAFMPAIEGQLVLDLVRPTLVRSRPGNNHRCEVCSPKGLVGSGDLASLPIYPRSV